MRRNVTKRIAVFLAVLFAVSSQTVFTAGATEGSTPVTGGGGITIDGYYDDWESVPKTKIDWNNYQGSGVVTHEGAALMDGENLYVYFKANLDYPQKILQKNDLRIKINGQQYNLKVLPVDKNGNKLEESNPDLANGIYTDYAVFLENRNWSKYNDGYVKVGGSVAYTVTKDGNGTKTTGDAIEFSMDVEKVADVLNIKADSMKEISIQNLFFGGTVWIEMVGSPTYAAMFFIIALPIVFAGYYNYSKRRKGMA